MGILEWLAKFFKKKPVDTYDDGYPYDDPEVAPITNKPDDPSSDPIYDVSVDKDKIKK